MKPESEDPAIRRLRATQCAKLRDDSQHQADASKPWQTDVATDPIKSGPGRLGAPQGP